MKKRVFQLFTIENGILLPTPVLEYIAGRFTDVESLRGLLRRCKAKFATPSLSMAQVLEVSNQKEGSRFDITSFKFAAADLNTAFQTLYLHVGATATQISLLKDGVEQLIFGLFFRDRGGRYALEDEHDVIELDLSGVEDEAFLFDNMFVGLVGAKAGIFVVKRIVLPKFPVVPPHVGSAKICIFSCYSGDAAFVRDVLARESPDLCVISAEEEKGHEFEGACANITICPSRAQCEFLPARFGSVSNPLVLEAVGNQIAFLDYNMFEQRKTGVSFNGADVEAFVRAVISQGSLCPFAGSNLSVPVFPNVFVIAQDFQPLVTDVDGVKVVSLPPVKNGYFGVLDFSQSLFEVRRVSR